MQKVKLAFWVLVISLSFGLSVRGADNLFLCGKIKGRWRDRIVFEVRSESCRGEHYLRVRDPKVRERILSLKGKTRCFMMRENTCQEEFTPVLP